MEYDSLEPRNMLAATISYDPLTYTVTVQGTAAGDIVHVNELGNNVEIVVTGGPTQQFFTEDLDLIAFSGGLGNDEFYNYSFVNSNLLGHAGDDILLGGGAEDYIHGGPGADTLTGSFGNDSIYGHDGDDVIDGGDGEDTIYGGNGNDSLTGGIGDDFLAGDWGDDTVYAGEGDDYVLGFTGQDQLFGGPGADRLYGQFNDDYMEGNDGDDTVRGGPGVDQLYGNAGDDYMQGDQDGDTMYGGDGADVMIGFDGDDYINGENGNDRLYGQNDNDEIHGGAGDDSSLGGAGDDMMYMEDGTDWASGDGGDDQMFGGDGNDTLFGRGGNDSISGGEGVDVLRGEAGDDVIRGDNGADTLHGGDGNDSIFGGILETDVVFGNAGNDRFLVDSVDSVGDQAAEDAALIFEPFDIEWTNAEVETLDSGFAQLYARTANNALLKDALPSGDLTFYKYVDLGSIAQNYLLTESTSEWNGSEWVTTYTYTREIRFQDWDETNQVENDMRIPTVIHEIGHNWDSTLELSTASAALTDTWNDFLNLSGWTDVDPQSSSYTLSGDQQWWYLNTSSFARTYGQTNPNEDFSTMFEFYFEGTGTSDPEIQAKLDLLDTIFNTL